MNAEARVADPVRDYWRETILRWFIVDAELLGIIPVGPEGSTQVTRLPRNVLKVAMAKASQLLDEAVRRERAAGKRDPAIAHNTETEIWRTLKPFAANQSLAL